jgi:hypothetical protein
MCETRTQGACIAALFTRLRTHYRAAQCFPAAGASLFSSLDRLSGPVARWKATLLGLLLAVTMLVTAIAILAAGCGARTEPPKRSMKGFELYSWQENGRWYFSVLEGTNRTKTVDEIHASNARLKGVDALGPVLRGIEAGQWVTWWTPSWAEGTVSFPPEDVVAQVRRLCEEQGLQLQVVGQGP